MAKAHRVLTKVVLAIRVEAALSVVIAQSVKIAALALVMLRSELSGTPWSTLKWLCASWLLRRMASH
jgi:hypothetical protein